MGRWEVGLEVLRLVGFGIRDRCVADSAIDVVRLKSDFSDYFL